MKSKLLIIPFLLVSLVVLAVSGIACCKATGGGFLLCEEGPKKVTFGFTAQATELIEENGDWKVIAKGKFQLIDHSDKIKVHGTFKELCIDEPLSPLTLLALTASASLMEKVLTNCTLSVGMRANLDGVTAIE